MFISGTGLGKWGETHTMTYTTGDDTPRMAVAEWVTDVYTRYFKHVPLIINYHRTILSKSNFTDNATIMNGAAEIIDMAVAKGYSLRHDAFGMKQYYKDWERAQARKYLYKRPLIMEGGWVESSHGGSIKGDGYADHGEVRWGEYYEGKAACVNMMDFRYSKGSGETWRWFNNAYEAVTEFIAEGAYRLYPDKVSVPVSAKSGHDVSFTHRWSNLGWGYCPTNIPQWNQKYKVAFALLDRDTEKPVFVSVDEALPRHLDQGQALDLHHHLHARRRRSRHLRLGCRPGGHHQGQRHRPGNLGQGRPHPRRLAEAARGERGLTNTPISRRQPAPRGRAVAAIRSCHNHYHTENNATQHTDIYSLRRRYGRLCSRRMGRGRSLRLQGRLGGGPAVRRPHGLDLSDGPRPGQARGRRHDHRTGAGRRPLRRLRAHL